MRQKSQRLQDTEWVSELCLRSVHNSTGGETWREKGRCGATAPGGAGISPLSHAACCERLSSPPSSRRIASVGAASLSSGIASAPYKGGHSTRYMAPVHFRSGRDPGSVCRSELRQIVRRGVMFGRWKARTSRPFSFAQRCGRGMQEGGGGRSRA